jgi:uncharacterized protein YheU (UPF0270 family)
MIIVERELRRRLESAVKNDVVENADCFFVRSGTDKGRTERHLKRVVG